MVLSGVALKRIGASLYCAGSSDNAVEGVFKSNGRGAFDESAFKSAAKEGNWWSRLSKTNKILAGVAAGAVVVGAGVAFAKSRKNKQAQATEAQNNKSLSTIA